MVQVESLRYGRRISRRRAYQGVDHYPMNSFRRSFAFFLLGIALVAMPVLAADSPELAEARARLLEEFQRGRTDDDVGVKQLRLKIAALEYIANAKASGTGEAAAKLINVDFPGGPMSALLAVINKDGGAFNVVGEKTDLAIELPALALRNADGASLANALGGLLQQRGYFLGGAGRTVPGQAPVFVLRKAALHEIDHRNIGQFQSFQLAPFLEHQSVDDIIGAIRTAWELDPANKADALRLKFHPPTGILLASAPPQGLSVVQAVLAQLRKSEPAKPKAEPAPAPAKR
jgi:hypothetical protein